MDARSTNKKEDEYFFFIFFFVFFLSLEEGCTLINVNICYWECFYIFNLTMSTPEEPVFYRKE